MARSENVTDPQDLKTLVEPQRSGIRLQVASHRFWGAFLCRLTRWGLGGLHPLRGDVTLGAAVAS